MKTIYICAVILVSFVGAFALPAAAQGLWTIQLTSFKAESKNGNVGLSWKTTSEQNLREFEIETSSDGKYYRNLGFIPALNSINGGFYEFEHPVSYTDSAFYRLKIVDDGGRWLYTKPQLYRVNKITAFFIYPSVITTGVMNIFLNDPFNWLQVVSMNGTVILKENLDGRMGRINIPLSKSFNAGTYVVQVGNYNKTITQQVIIQ